MTDVNATPRRVRAIVRRLERRFGALVPPRAADPLDELILTVLSQHTSDVNADRAFASLRTSYPTWAAVVAAPEAAVADAIRSGGLANTKAPRIQAILQEVHDREGAYDLARLPDVPPGDRPEDGGRRPVVLARPRRDPGGHTRPPGRAPSRPRPAEGDRRAGGSAAARAGPGGSAHAVARRPHQAGARDLQGADAALRSVSPEGSLPDGAALPLVSEPASCRRSERVRGIEPPFQAWEACVLPLNHTRVVRPPERPRQV